MRTLVLSEEGVRSNLYFKRTSVTFVLKICSRNTEAKPDFQAIARNHERNRGGWTETMEEIR